MNRPGDPWEETRGLVILEAHPTPAGAWAWSVKTRGGAINRTRAGCSATFYRARAAARAAAKELSRYVINVRHGRI